MDEEKKPQVEAEKKGEESQAEKSEKDNPQGDKPASSELIKAADAAAKRLELANKKQEELLRRQEDLAARKLLSGKSDAGQAEEKPKPQTPQEYAQSLFNGEIQYKD